MAITEAPYSTILPYYILRRFPPVSVLQVDMEKHLEHNVSEETPRHEAVSTVTETSSLKRDLSSRHINMIAIAGMIVSPHVHILIGS